MFIAVGILYFRAHLDSLLDYCKTGVEQGAKLVYGGKRCDRKGTLVVCSINSTSITSLPPFLRSDAFFFQVTVIRVEALDKH